MSEPPLKRRSCTVLETNCINVVWTYRNWQERMRILTRNYKIFKYRSCMSIGIKQHWNGEWEDEMETALSWSKPLLLVFPPDILDNASLRGPWALNRGGWLTWMSLTPSLKYRLIQNHSSVLCAISDAALGASLPAIVMVSLPMAMMS